MRADRWATVHQAVDSVIDELARTGSCTGLGRPDERQFRHRFKSLKKALSAITDVAVTFRLERNGIATFNLPHFSDRVLFKNSVDLILTKPDFRDFGGSPDDYVNFRETEQAFFFLRDLAHRHQHHDPSSEKILSLQTVDKNNDWLVEALKSVYCSVISSKRGTSAAKNADALGLLAYARSLKQILRQVGGARATDTLPYFNENALRYSIEATKDKLAAAEQSHSANAQSKTGVKTLVVTIWALVMSATSAIIALKPSTAEPDDFTACAIHFSVVHANWWLGLILILALSKMLSELVRKTRAWRACARASKRIAVGANQRPAVVASIVAGFALIVFLATIYLAQSSSGERGRAVIEELFRPVLNVASCWPNGQKWKQLRTEKAASANSPNFRLLLAD